MVIKNTNNVKKIILLILLIVFLLGSSVLAIDFVSSYFGLYFPIPVIKKIKEMALSKKLLKGENPFLLEKEELSKDNERLSIVEEQLRVKEKELEQKELDVSKQLESLKEKEKELEQKNSALDEKETKFKDIQKNILEQAVKLYNMPPLSAVAILEKQPEADIVDILRAIDRYSEDLGRNSISPYYLKILSDINKEKAGVVLRMIKYPTGDKMTTVESVEAKP